MIHTVFNQLLKYYLIAFLETKVSVFLREKNKKSKNCVFKFFILRIAVFYFVQITRTVLILQLKTKSYITAESVKNRLDGIGEKETRLLKLFKEHNEELYQRIGTDTTVATYNVYLFAYDCLSDFLKYKYDIEDIAINRVTLSFIKDYDFYLRNVRKMKDNSIYMLMTRLKKMLNRAAKQGTIKKNPFSEYSHGKSEMVCRYLQPDELERIMQAQIIVADFHFAGFQTQIL